VSGRISLLELHVQRVLGDYLRSPEFKAHIAKCVRWGLQGFASGYAFEDRERFTKTVAKRLRKRARRPIYFMGRRIWWARETWAFCSKEAERIVTEFLRGEKIKFGDPRFDWNCGADLADTDMDYWEACR
jgi:hypothetical protein